MTSGPQIPPAAPPALPQKQAQPAGPVVAAKAPVRDAPEGLKHPDRPQRIEGRVVASDPQAKEIRIATARGDVVISSDAPLPPGTEVSVELYMQKAQTLANIALLQKQDEAAKEILKAVAPQAPQPAPPLKEGDKVIVVKLPGETPAPPPPAPSASVMTLKEAARIIGQARTSGIEKFPLPLPLPPEIIIAVAKSKDVLATLQKLPPEQQEKIITFLRQPAVSEYIKTALPPLPPAGEGRGEDVAQDSTTAQNTARDTLSQPSPAGGRGEADEIPLFNVVKTPSSQTEEKQSALPKPVIAALSALLPLVEKAGPVATPLQAALRQFVPQPATAVAAFPLADAPVTQEFFQITVRKILPPDAGASKLQPAQQQGVVEAVTKGGFPIIRAEVNGVTEHFVSRAPADIPVGSTVVFDMKPMTIEQVAQAIASQTSFLPAAVPPGYTPGEKVFDARADAWPALQEALQVMAQSPQAAAVRNTVPIPAAPKFTPTALFFLAALRLGGIESWLGNNTLQALRDAGRKDLADKLAGDFGRLSAQSKEQVAGEWRMISMPLLHDEQLSQLQFYVRKQQDDDAEKDGDRKTVTRFILNLNLSRMGGLQLDGLLRQRQFDLILRTEEVLPLNMRQDLMQAFATGLNQSGMQGGIGFQVRRDNWVTVEVQERRDTVA